MWANVKDTDARNSQTTEHKFKPIKDFLIKDNTIFSI